MLSHGYCAVERWMYAVCMSMTHTTHTCMSFGNSLPKFKMDRLCVYSYDAEAYIELHQARCLLLGTA